MSIQQNGETPLHIAVGKGHEAVVSALLAAGTDKNLQNKVPLVNAVLIRFRLVRLNSIFVASPHQAHL